VSLAPNITEILFALGLKDRVVGVTSDCSYPQGARSVAKIGKYDAPSLERILALTPDLIFCPAEGRLRRPYDALRSMGFPVVELHFRHIDDIPRLIEIIGRRTGKEAEAEQLAERLRRKRAQIARTVRGRPRVRVLFILGHDPLVAAGPGCFAHELIETAGGENVAAESRTAYPRLSLEEVVAGSPGIIVEASMGSQAGAAERRLRFWKKWPAIPAVRDGKVFFLDPDQVLRPGPRLFDGMEQMARLLHPHAFRGKSAEPTGQGGSLPIGDGKRERGENAGEQ
jgi:iron complex transport system substrate-binding protein